MTGADLLQLAIQREPDLAYGGLLPFIPDGVMVDERLDAFRRGRDQLLASAEEVAVAAAWLSRLKQTRRASAASPSSLIAATACTLSRRLDQPISSGVMLAAAVALGIPYMPLPHSPHAALAVVLPATSHHREGNLAPTKEI